MPPHCDSLDGPVVRVAQRALDAGNVAFVLPYVQKEGEKEIIDTFDKILQVRRTNAISREGRSFFLPRPWSVSTAQGKHLGVDDARAYVQAMLGLQVWAHGLNQRTHATGHPASHTHD